MRFNHLHIDLIGPLSPSRYHRYFLACVDRFARWCEAIPFGENYAETVLLTWQNWITLFITSKYVTTDRGPQFESTLFFNLRDFLGCERIGTTACIAK